MGIFDTLRQAVQTESMEHRFTCRTCGQRYELEYHVCPKCGGFSVE